MRSLSRFGLAGIFAIVAVSLVAAQTVRPFILNLTGGEYIQVESPLSAQIAYTSVNALRDGRDYVYVNAPSAGFTVAMTQLNSAVTINPTGTLASGTVNLPATALDGRIATFYTTQTITAFTLNAASGSTVASPPTTLAAGPAGRLQYVYNASLKTWLPY